MFDSIRKKVLSHDPHYAALGISSERKRLLMISPTLRMRRKGRERQRVQKHLPMTMGMRASREVISQGRHRIKKKRRKTKTKRKKISGWRLPYLVKRRRLRTRAEQVSVREKRRLRS